MKVAAAGDSAESVGVGAVMGADEGSGCNGCALNDSVGVDSR